MALSPRRHGQHGQHSTTLPGSREAGTPNARLGCSWTMATWARAGRREAETECRPLHRVGPALSCDLLELREATSTLEQGPQKMRTTRTPRLAESRLGLFLLQLGLPETAAVNPGCSHRTNKETSSTQVYSHFGEPETDLER